jgi:16S rRNA (guanine1207-N2)-methyltransferase
MEHYYSNKPTSEINEEKFEAVFNGRKFHFKTSSGVFSKKFVDFGSILLIKTFLEDYKKSESKILDVGCGYGPIGIIIASFFKGAKVDMVDINERAIEFAGINATDNNVSNVHIFISDIYESVSESYDAIVTNPPIRAGKKTVFAFFEGALKRLAPGGNFYCVIQKKQGAESAFKKLNELFGNCEMIARKSGYQILKSRKS